MDADDCKALAQKLKFQEVNLNQIFPSLNSKFSDYSWFERIQQLIIKLTLDSSRRLGEDSLWDEVLDHLAKEMNEQPGYLRFAAHFAVTLMLQNRVSQNHLPAYNSILAKYIEIIASSDQIHDNIKNEMIPFYTSLLVGVDQQCVSYAKVMLGVTDDARLSQISQQNQRVFRPDMIVKLT